MNTYSDTDILFAFLHFVLKKENSSRETAKCNPEINAVLKATS